MTAGYFAGFLYQTDKNHQKNIKKHITFRKNEYLCGRISLFA